MTVVTLPAGQMASGIVRANRLFGFDANGQAALYDTAAATGAVPGAINVKLAPYNAKGDGATDDTDALQAALDAAAATLATDYYGTLKASVYLPPGDYRHRGLDVQPRVTLYGDSPGNVSLTLRGGMNRSSIRVLAAPSSDPAQRAEYEHVLLAGFTIYGNSSNNTVGHGIEFVDPVYVSSTRYCVAGYLKNINIIGAKERGIQASQNRNWGEFDNLTIKSCGGDGVQIEGYDWRGSNFDIGSNGGYGLVYSGGAHSFSNFAIYGHALANGYAYGKSWSAWTNGSFGSSTREAFIVGNTDGLPIHLTNVRFAGSSSSAHNTYPAIRVDGARAATLTGCEFIGQSASIKANYIIQHAVTPTVPIHLAACYWPPASDTVGKPFATAEFSHPEWIYGAVQVEASGVYGARIGVAGAALGELRANGDLPVLKWQGVASGSNYLALQNGATSASPRFTTTSGVTDCGIDLYAKNNGIIRLRSNQGSGFQVQAPASAVNYIQVNGAVTTVAPTLAAAGTDTNVNLRLTGQGTGAVVLRAQASLTLGNNNDLGFEATSNTSVTLRMRGSDGVTRSVALTLA